MTQRRILRLSGPDTRTFLQGLVTNDVDKIEAGLVYAALLTPQGKYLADFFLAADGQNVLLDLPEALDDMVETRLNMYRLRADVQIQRTDLQLHRGLGQRPQDAFDDPRHTALGWRAYRTTAPEPDATDWTALRITHLIPQSGEELHPDTFILEAGFERLNGVDFRKGCYVGQEVTARMKHKTELRKGYARVALSEPTVPGTEITANGKVAGRLHSSTGLHAIAYLRFDRAVDPMQAGSATVTRL